MITLRKIILNIYNFHDPIVGPHHLDTVDTGNQPNMDKIRFFAAIRERIRGDGIHLESNFNELIRQRHITAAESVYHLRRGIELDVKAMLGGDKCEQG